MTEKSTTSIFTVTFSNSFSTVTGNVTFSGTESSSTLLYCNSTISTSNSTSNIVPIPKKV